MIILGTLKSAPYITLYQHQLTTLQTTTDNLIHLKDEVQRSSNRPLLTLSISFQFKTHVVYTVPFGTYRPWLLLSTALCWSSLYHSNIAHFHNNVYCLWKVTALNFHDYLQRSTPTLGQNLRKKSAHTASIIKHFLWNYIPPTWRIRHRACAQACKSVLVMLSLEHQNLIFLSLEHQNLILSVPRVPKNNIVCPQSTKNQYFLS